MEKTHWKNNFNYDYLGAYSFREGQSEAKFTIKSIKVEKVKGPSGRSSECTIVHFKEKFNGVLKPMILNKTNCKTIAKMYDTPYIQDWINKTITVYVEREVEAFGDVVSALRISPIKPVLPELILDSDKFKKAIEYMGSEGASIANIEKQYKLSVEVKSKLEAV